jgi:hypothetical protein
VLIETHGNQPSAVVVLVDNIALANPNRVAVGDKT